MISASVGSLRFESGPTYYFNGSNFDDLISVVQDPSATADYVNALPNVGASPQEIRDLAASGIARLAVNGADMVLLHQAGEALIKVCAGNTIDSSDFTDTWNRNGLFRGEGLKNHILDSASVIAMRKNKAEETAGIIAETAPADEGYFMIALANGGLISAARTFLQLGEGDHGFGMVRYSRHKHSDTEPELHPYPRERQSWLEAMAAGRQVVVYDEDHSSGDTLKTATEYFACLLKTKVLGIAPVEVERRVTFNPLVVEANHTQ